MCCAVNIARGRPTLQSSTAYNGISSRAVDGTTNSDWSAASCTHTQTESSPWWRVDLEQTIAVGEVTVYNRGDCCGDRLSEFEVRVGASDSFASGTSCGTASRSIHLAIVCISHFHM